MVGNNLKATKYLVGRVVDLLGFPFSLEGRVVDHGWLPLSVHLIIPIFRFLGLGVGDVLWNIPVIRLDILGIIDLSTVIPILGFLGFGVLDLLGGEEIPVSLQVTRLNFLIINQDLQ